MAKTDTKTVSIVLLLYFLVVSGLILYIISKYREEYTRCNIINKNTKDNISKITAGDNIKYDTIIENNYEEKIVDFPCLVNYKIKTAYNCCAVNSFKNSFVSDCALRHCIQSGAKCLDFEIYSVEGKPVVGLSSRETNINMKESYNKLDFFRAMKIVNNQMNSGNIVNKDLPMIIHLRMKTKNRKIYDVMARDIYNAFQERLLNSNFSYLNEKKKIGNEDTLPIREKPLIFQSMTAADDIEAINTEIHSNFKRKVIIVINIKALFNSNNAADDFEKFLEKNGQPGMLLNYTNLLIPSHYADQENDIGIVNANEDQRSDFKDITQQKLYFTSPLVSNSSKNVKFENHHALGFQMVALSFQNFKASRDLNDADDLTNDSQIAKYHKLFKDNGCYVRKDNAELIRYFYMKDKPEADTYAAITPLGTAGGGTAPSS